jgi:predicted DNA-binding transcriptional regulator YafY
MDNQRKPSRLTHPDLDVLASVTRAIHQECPLAIEYHSITSGRTEREIVPFALLDNGSRWHVRAFDRKSQEFRDFVITRIKNPVVMKGAPVQPHERSDQDIQWTRIVELELVPHPDQPRPEITEMDYSMDSGRAAHEAACRHCRIHPAPVERGLLTGSQPARP